MRGRGFDRSPTMCTDKWRNLLKEFKKAKQSDRARCGYKEIEAFFLEREAPVWGITRAMWLLRSIRICSSPLKASMRPVSRLGLLKVDCLEVP